MDISVSELLSTKLLGNSKVIAGSGGLGNLIKSATVIENLDAINWLHGGELVMTNGYSLKNNHYAQEVFVDNLVLKGASALALKIRYLGKVPSVLEERANLLDFPVILIDESVAWRDIIEYVLNYIPKKQTNELEKKEFAYKNFLDKAMQEDTLLKITRELYIWTGFPVTIFNMRTNQFFSEPNSFSIPDGLLENKEHWRVIKTLKSLGDGNYIFLYNWQNSNLLYSWIGSEIKLGGYTEGYICLWVKETELKSSNLTCLDYAISAVTMELKHLKLLQDVNLKYRNQFLYFILHSSFRNIDDLFQKTNEMYWFPKQFISVLVMEVVSNKNNEKRFIITRAIEEALGKLDPNNQCFYGWDNYERVVIILSDEQKQYLKKFGENISTLVAKLLPDQNFFIGLSTPLDILNIYDGYEEAKHASYISRLKKEYNQVCCYNDLGIYRILRTTDLSSYQSFCEDILGPLIEYDQSRNTRFLETLNVFVETGYSYKKTAEKLFLHQNSVRYRIQTIEKICNLNFDIYDDRLNTEVALKIVPLFGEINNKGCNC